MKKAYKPFIFGHFLCFHLPIVVITVTEYKSASLNDHRGKRSPIVSAIPPFVAFIIDPSKRRNCSCTNIVQFRS